MNELNIKLTGERNLGNVCIYVDGKPAKFRKNEFRNLVYKHETENGTARIEIYKYLDCGGILWFFTQLFFFLISIFGIFDTHDRNGFLVLDFEAEVELKQSTNLTLHCGYSKDGEKAAEIESDAPVTVEANECVVDESAKRKFKLLRIAKIITFIVAMVAIVLSIIVSIIN